MKIQKIFCHKKEAIMCNHQINTFCCQQRWMEHKEGTGKSMKNVLYVYTSLAKVTTNSERIMCVTLAIVKLRWDQAGS